MNNAVQEQNQSAEGFRPSHGPGPALLPGIEGFYVLTAAGALGRYRTDGRFVEDPSLTEQLGFATAALLQQYRNGDCESIAIGLVTRRTPDKPWHCASLVFSDGALKEVYRTGDDPRAPLTAFQKRNKSKSVYRGMELVLETRNPSQPQYPRYCPVLVAPEYGSDALSRRYGVNDMDAINSLEVLDLMAPLHPEDHRHPALSRMVVEMSQSRIEPELRHQPELAVVDDAPGRSHAGEHRFPADDPRYGSPWEDEPEPRHYSFNDGDPVPYWLLASFTPFNELNDLQRQFVARGHTVTQKPAGATLIERGSTDDVTLYLVDGTLELEAFDGRKMSIDSGSRRAHLPISQLHPHAFTVKAASNASVIFVSQDMVREINRITNTYRSRTGIEVKEENAMPGIGKPGVDYQS